MNSDCQNKQMDQVDEEVSENQIQQIIDYIEDEFLHESLYSKAIDFLNGITNQKVRQNLTILCIEARILVYEDPVKSEKQCQNLFEQDPTFFRNTFEYLTLLFDSYESKAEEVQKKLQPIMANYQGDTINDGYYLACKGLIVKSKKNMSPSRKLLEQAISVIKKPFQKSDIYSQLGNTFLELEEYQNALKYYQKGIQLQPRNDECLNNISYCYLELHELQKSIFYGELALQNYQYNSTVLCNLAIVYEELNQLDKAEQAYQTLFKNKSIGAVQHANYAQFLYEHRIDNYEKRLLIIKNLTQGFSYDPTNQNSIFPTFQALIRLRENFSKMMYSYEPITYLMEFFESIREKAPHILHSLNEKFLLILKNLKQDEADEEFEDISDESFQEEDEEEEEQENSDTQNLDNNLEKENILDQQQPALSQLKSLDQNENNQGQKQQEIQQKQEQRIEHQPYFDKSMKQEISTHQKVLLYSLIQELVEVKKRENQTLNSLISYNKFISQQLHFQSQIQFWDLYFD